MGHKPPPPKQVGTGYKRTAEEIAEFKAIDRRMAERMGWRDVEDLGFDQVGWRPDHPPGRGKLPIPRPSQSREAALKLIDWLLDAEKAERVVIELAPTEARVHLYTLYGPAPEQRAPEMPLAVCRAVDAGYLHGG